MSIENHLDVVILDELKMVLEDEFSVLITTFLNDSIDQLKNIRAAVESQNADQLRRSAHSFKGSSGNIGAHKLSSICKELEEMGRLENFGEIDEKLHALVAEKEMVSQLLQDNYS